MAKNAHNPKEFRGVVGNPNGNREERRAWRKLQKSGHQVDAILEKRDLTPDPDPDTGPGPDTEHP